MDYIIFIAMVITKIKGEGNDKIVGGLLTEVKKFPYIGSFQIAEYSQTKHHCTAVLIHWTFALTAGHCVLSNKSPVELSPAETLNGYLVMGVTNSEDSTNEFYQKRRVSKLAIHQKAKYGPAAYMVDPPFPTEFDIGALGWATPMEKSVNVRPAPMLPHPADDPFKDIDFNEILRSGEKCEIPGYGTDVSSTGRKGRKSIRLKSAKFLLLDNKECCESFYPSEFSRCMIRIGLTTGIECYINVLTNETFAVGDCGSPIVCPYKGGHVVVGIGLGPGRGNDGSPDARLPGYRISNAAMIAYIKVMIGAHVFDSETADTDFGIKESFDPSLTIFSVIAFLCNINKL